MLRLVCERPSDPSFFRAKLVFKYNYKLEEYTTPIKYHCGWKLLKNVWINNNSRNETQKLVKMKGNLFRNVIWNRRRKFKDAARDIFGGFQTLQDIRKITRTLFCINVLEVWPYKKRWPLLLFWYEAEKRALWILKMIFLLWEKSLEVRKWWLFDPITDITLGAVKLHSSSNAVEQQRWRRAQKWSNNPEGFSHPITMAFWGIRRGIIHFLPPAWFLTD